MPRGHDITVNKFKFSQGDFSFEFFGEKGNEAVVFFYGFYMRTSQKQSASENAFTRTDFENSLPHFQVSGMNNRIHYARRNKEILTERFFGERHIVIISGGNNVSAFLICQNISLCRLCIPALLSLNVFPEYQI